MNEIDIKCAANEATRKYLFEHFKEIDNERTKASYLIAFEGLIFVELLYWMDEAPIWIKVGFVGFVGLSMLASLFQLFFPSKAAIYGDYSKVYSGEPKDPETFLKEEFDCLQTQGGEAMELSIKARRLNKISFVLVALSLIFPICYFFII